MEHSDEDPGRPADDLDDIGVSDHINDTDSDTFDHDRICRLLRSLEHEVSLIVYV